MFASSILFLSSYLPLLLMLAFRFEGTVARGTVLLIILVIVILAFVVFEISRSIEGEQCKVERAESLGPEIAGYIPGYLLPFVSVTRPALEDFVLYAIFFSVTWFIYIRSDLIQINPVLYVIGFRVYKVETDRFDGYVISRSAIEKGSIIECREFANSQDVRIDWLGDLQPL